MKKLMAFVLALPLAGCTVYGTTRPAQTSPRYRTVAECPRGYVYDGSVCRDASRRVYNRNYDYDQDDQYRRY